MTIFKCPICGDIANAGIIGGKLVVQLCDRCSRFFLCGIYFGETIKDYHCQVELDAAMDSLLTVMSEKSIIPLEAVMPVESFPDHEHVPVPFGDNEEGKE